ncbi:MAG: HAMP domain-containing histidine kinase [Crocinitomicaceae bacterium]|nr:HAMP domain-containing histidine kinase [Crocinitomicaceae bacterium]
MRKIRVNFIFAMVVVALIAVLVIQAFQTLQLYDRKHAEFEMNLSTSMERIAIRHEKAEDIRRYMHIVNRDFSGQYKDVLKEEFKHLVSAQESISIQDTTLYDNGEIQNYLIIKGKSFDSLTGLTTEQKVLARDVRQLRDLFDKQKKQIPHNDSIKLAIQLDQRVLQQIFKKAKFVNDMMVEAFRNNVYEDPSKRIDAVFLDSVIRTEIANDNLPKTYRFMVANEYGIPIQFDNAPSNYDTKLDTLLTGKSVLFPSNILDEDLYLHIYFPKKGFFLFQEMWGPFTISLTLMILIVVALMFMFRTILTQEKISEIKNDFISNMTHEFKTPISTISLACEALSDQDMMKQNTTDIAPFVKMINDENKRLSLLVERILQSAVMDRGEVKLREEKVILNEIIHEVTNHAQFRIQNSGGTIKLNIPNELITIQTDKMHMTNIVTNLVDNAIKYSSEAPDIEISLRRENKKLLLSVKDHGIGIKKEHLNKVFDKLYRVPTGNVHNVKGFGLGLSYVKAIAELHDWNVVVRSKYGEGSEFTLVMKEL